MSGDTTLSALRAKIPNYGKENLGELLYSLAEGAGVLSAGNNSRIYLEDLTRGALTCAHATGENAPAIRETSFPLISEESIISAVFASQLPADFRPAGGAER